MPSRAIVPWHVAASNRLDSIPFGLTRQFAAILPLDAYPLPFDVAANQIIMQWNRRRDHDPGLNWLRDLFSDVARTSSARSHRTKHSRHEYITRW